MSSTVHSWLFLFSLLSCLSTRSYAAAATCQKYYSDFRGEDVHYCIQRTTTAPQLKGEAVVYFMHGLTGDSWSWIGNGYSVALQNLSQNGSLPNVPPATFVSFDTNPASFFSDYANASSGPRAYETWFLTEFMPMIETSLGLCNERRCRGVIGLSMGGFGALKTALRHPDLFAFSGANSPALGPMNIWESENAWSEHFANTPIGSEDGLFLLNLTREIFPSADVFDENNPVILASRVMANRPALYFDVGSQDDFGFEIGFSAFQQVLNAYSWTYESTLVAGANHSLFTTRRYDLLKWVFKQIPQR